MKPVEKPWIACVPRYVAPLAITEKGKSVVKLSANENALGPSKKALAAYLGDAGQLGRYPDPSASRLRNALAQAHGLEADRIVCGTGSDELLFLAAAAFAGPGDEIIHVRHGFVVFDIATRRAGATPIVAPDALFGVDLSAIATALTNRTKAVFIANPNNPTGTFLRADGLKRLHSILPADVLLVVDQAYAEYANEDDGAFELARQHPNLLVTRTFSKVYALASQRIGWAYGSPDIVDTIAKIRAPFSVTQAGQNAAVEALRDEEHLLGSLTATNRNKARLIETLQRLAEHGVSYVESRTNFILTIYSDPAHAETVYQRLLQSNILTRWLPDQGLPQAIRITIGDDGDTTRLCHALESSVFK